MFDFFSRPIHLFFIVEHAFRHIPSRPWWNTNDSMQLHGFQTLHCFIRDRDL